MNHRKSTLGVRFLLLLTPLWTDLSAQVPADLSFDTILVSSTLIPQRSYESGRNITVMDGEDLAALPYTSWDELLQRVPGLEVQSRNGFGAQADLLIRGSTFTQVLILLDGMRLNDPLTGHFNGNIPVPVVEVERIEILRGPAAAIYGPDAVGGVIHFITKTWDRPFNRPMELPGQFNYGKHQLIQGNQGLVYSKENLNVTGGINLTQSKGEPIAEKRIGQTVLEPYRNYFDVLTVGLSAAAKMNEKTSLHVRSAFDRRDFSARYFYTNSPFDKSTEKTSSWWNQAKILIKNRRSITDVNLAHRLNDDEFIFSPDFSSTNSHTSRLSQVQLNHHLIIYSNWSMKGGLQYDRRSIKSNDRGNHQDDHLGFYLTSLWQPSRRINLTGSSRLDYDANYGWEFSPQLNASVHLGALMLRFSAGRSIRAADYTERYVSNNLMNLTPGRSLGNPWLEAERSWSEEFGMDYLFGKGWSLRTTVFARQSRNLIDYVPTLAQNINNNENLLMDEEYFYAQNISRVKTRGLELEIWYQQDLQRHNRLQIGLGYTFLDTKNNEDVISVYLSNHARHLVTSHYVLKLGRWEVGLTSLLKSRNERFVESILADLKPNYLVFDGRIRFALAKKIRLNVQVNNFFNESYANILGAPMPSRWWMIGAEWKL